MLTVNRVWMLVIGILEVLPVQGHECSCDCPTPQHHQQPYQLPVQLVYLNHAHAAHGVGTATGSQLLLYANHRAQHHPQHSHAPVNVIAHEPQQHHHHQYQNQYTPAPVNHAHQDQHEEYGASQPVVSKVSSHQDNHYINIEQHISPKLHSDKTSDEDHKDHHHDKNVYYKFEYEVNDQKTHDVKHHKEERKGDVVEGEYSLLEEDGNVRTVKYYADWKNGFHANVHNSKKAG
ncbi:unnamed protein product [Acanthoscelides obtectus]|uniref:Uncharacterized protein n=1 Tax=Acanthoscelides obtectus TaxID=200917 RepID=A0A9P0KR28_ACAOB|nr:unnamed protein product [Acanthoscelides obtectus]CAK1664412.1 hypothetical protein AOBTE_LOCUS24249 [Acanthoscelides obtectus]